MWADALPVDFCSMQGNWEQSNILYSDNRSIDVGGGYKQHGHRYSLVVTVFTTKQLVFAMKLYSLCLQQSRCANISCMAVEVTCIVFC